MPEDDDNPAFVLLRILQNNGWTFYEIDTESFLGAAEYFDSQEPADTEGC
jgi:hypothetical protein